MVTLEAASLTDPGLLREANEDSAWAHVQSTSEEEPLGLFIVCDGMGGHMGGEFASYWAVEAIKHEFADLFFTKDPRATVILKGEDIEAVRAGEVIRPTPLEVDVEDLTQAAIQKANNVVYDYARHKPKQAANAGTTVTMAVVRRDQAIVANVGDSRTYLLRDGELRQVTSDHSLVYTMVAEGQIPLEKIYTHPQRNVIFRYLGQKGLVSPDIFYEELKPGDYLLLCSDGLWEMVRSDELLAEMVEAAEEPLEACQDLIAAANEAGGEDNISVVVVKIT